MATWSDIAQENLAAAKQLHGAEHVRSCLNRAYYCAYAHLTGVLVDAGHTVSSGNRANPGHQQLIELTRHNLPRGVGAGVVRMLRRLVSFRLAADYDPESQLSQTESLEALRSASKIMELTGG